RPGGWMSVSIMPGEMALMRTPSFATSRAAPMTIVSTAPFDAAYQMHSVAPPSVAAIDDSMTMDPPLPPRLVDMRRMAARRHSSAPSVLTSSTEAMVSVLASSSRENGPMMPEE